MAAGNVEYELVFIARVGREAQAGQDLFHAVAKTQGQPGNQVIGHAARGGLSAVTLSPAKDVLLAVVLAVERLKLLVSWGFGGTKQHPLDRSAGIRLAQHPQILELRAMQ